jgi:hypothetical protein
MAMTCWISEKYPYNERKLPTMGLYDRRNGELVCTYCTMADIRKTLGSLTKRN